MKLTVRTDYALRLLIYLMVHDDEPASVAQVSEAYSISSHHLAKVAGELARLGWIESRRGRGGGLSLQPAARALTVGDVVRTLEQSLQLVECQGPNNTCPIAPVCELKSVLQRASEAFLAVLDEVELVVLARDPAPLRALLGPGA